jgi:hypothetical protein
VSRKQSRSQRSVVLGARMPGHGEIEVRHLERQRQDDGEHAVRAVRRTRTGGRARLSFPGISHIAREGGAYRFVPIEYVNRDMK